MRQHSGWRTRWRCGHALAGNFFPNWVARQIEPKTRHLPSSANRKPPAIDSVKGLSIQITSVRVAESPASLIRTSSASTVTYLSSFSCCARKPIRVRNSGFFAYLTSCDPYRFPCSQNSSWCYDSVYSLNGQIFFNVKLAAARVNEGRRPAWGSL